MTGARTAKRRPRGLVAAGLVVAAVWGRPADAAPIPPAAARAPAVASAPSPAERAPSPSSTGDIEAVVVFPDRARVTRVAAARCEHGTARATFARLPATLDPRTLRGEVREAADVIGLASEQVNEAEVADARARALIAARDKIAADVRANEARQAALAAQLEDFDGFGDVFEATASEEMRNPSPGAGGWGKTLDGLAARMTALHADQRKLTVALRRLRLEDDRLARQLRDAGGGGPRATRTATVTIGCRARSEVTAVLTYVVPGATWQPEYDLDFVPAAARAKVGAGSARLTVGARVRQTTGEDWRGVRLSLSTARPKLGSEAPRPAPLLVDGYEHERGRVLVEAQERREQIGAGGGAAARGPGAAALDDKGNAFVLTLPHRVSVAADGRAVWAPVDVVEAPAVVKLVATPKLDEHVYQMIALKNPAAYPLLEGTVRSYRAGSYVGQAPLRYRGVGEPIEVSLGLDDEVKVERKVLDDRSRDPSFLSGTKHLQRAARTTLTNRAASAVTVELRDHIPVAQIADVKVEILAGQTTGGYALDAARGLVTWTVPLKPAEARNIDLAYVIHLPDAWLVGGR